MVEEEGVEGQLDDTEVEEQLPPPPWLHEKGKKKQGVFEFGEVK